MEYVECKGIDFPVTMNFNDGKVDSQGRFVTGLMPFDYESDCCYQLEF